MARGSGDEEELSIIAMKGYPFTRKTELAGTIATSLGCPMLSSEDVLKCLAPPLSPEREFEAFRSVCEIAVSHLRKRISKNVVIDSPLSSQSHLNQLTSSASTVLVGVKVRVIIIECKPMNKYSWKMKFEHHLAVRSYHDNGKRWYKANDWEDVEKAIQENPDYDILGSTQHHKLVSKLVVDPLVDCPVQISKGVARVAPRVANTNTNSDLVRAVEYMKARDNKGDGLDVVVYRKWLEQSRYQSSSVTLLDKKYCSRNGHDIISSSKLAEQEHKASEECMACRKEILRSNNKVDEYCYCKNCSLALHMECAQAFNDDHEGRKRGYSFRKEFRLQKPLGCNSCRESGEGMSDYCKTCLFELHLRSGLYPTVIKHFDTDEHFLTIWFKVKQNNISLFRRTTSYPCVACGEMDGTCMYFCNDHGVAYCYECVTLPRRVKDEHGGHHHNLSLRFTSEEAEDYVCLECLDFRDPMLWFYSCEDCPGYQVHPHCVDKIRCSHPVFQRRPKGRLRSKVNTS